MKLKSKKHYSCQSWVYSVVLIFSCNPILLLLVVIAYTGQSSYSSYFSPAFITVAANDEIANVNTVERRVENLRNAGVEVEYRRYQSAGHGFGLGTGTDAEGWVDLAVQFWQRHIDE